MVRGRASRERLLLPLVLVLGALLGLGWILRDEAAEARQRVQYEDLALEKLRRLAQAQKAWQATSGAFGWVEDLQRAGLLGGLVIEEREGMRVVSSPRYRIDVQLPYLRVPGEIVRVRTRAEGDPDPELVKGHFALVARPWSEGEPRGFRTFYLGDTGNVYVSEGVSDVPSRTRRPLPDILLTTRGVPPEVVGLRWYLLDQLPPD